MSILKEIPDLLQAGVINTETADRIKDYYKSKGDNTSQRLMAIFGVLGAILVGLGIILIIAHNWDDFSNTTKTVFAFLPLVIGQIGCVYTLLQKKESIAWREGSSAFVFFAVGASISMVSQIYHLQGELSSFLLTWMVLCLPLIYVMNSSVTSLLYLLGITYYGCEACYWSYPHSESFYFWGLLLLALPHYYRLYKQSPNSNFMTFHHWIVPLSVVIMLGSLANNEEEIMSVAYFSLFGFLYVIGNFSFFTNQPSRNNGYKIIGVLGTLSGLMTLSFDWFWEDMRKSTFQFPDLISSPEFIAGTLLTLLGIGAFYFLQRSKPFKEIKPLSLVFLVFPLILIMGTLSPIGAVLINLMVLTIGVLTIWEGARKDHFGILNLGLLTISVLIACRFFDTDISFVTRGIMFIALGSGFFATNYWMLQKRKTNELQ